jgi:endoglucanase
VKKHLLLWFLLAVSSIGLTPPTFAQSEDAPQPPDNYRQLPDIAVFADTAYGQWVGSGNNLEIEKTEDGKLPVDESEMFDDLPSYRVRVTGEKGWWSFILAGHQWESYSIKPYYPDGALEFNIKGTHGGETFDIALQDNVTGRNPEGVSSEKILITDVTRVTDEWQRVRIPLSAFLPNSAGFNLDQLFTIGFAGNAPKAEMDGEMTFWLNNIRFTSDQEEPSHAVYKMNQLGFTPNGLKLAYISDFGELLSAQAGTPFTVRSVANNQIVYEGELTLVTEYDPIASGEEILMADFSDLQAPGEYYLSVDAYRMDDSDPFLVDEAAYQDLLVDTSRYYFLQRSGMPLEPEFAGQFAREAGHPHDAEAVFRSKESKTKDVAGGWYDAGDYGKYVNAGATAISDLLWAYELFPDQFPDDHLNIPESGNGLPDLLDEVRWELDWILKMQDETSGGFYHMVQPTEDGTVQNAVEQRFIEDVDEESNRENVRPTSTTASAVAALAHAATIFETVDPDYAADLLAAAEAGWGYLIDNPDGVAPIRGPYRDQEDSDNRFWAASALYRATGDDEYNDYVKENYLEIETLFESETDNAYSVSNMEMIGWLMYAASENPDAEVMDHFATIFNAWSARMVTRWQESNWNVAMLDEDFFWGSNNVTMTTPLVMVIGSQALGDLDETAVIIAKQALDYNLGRNPLGFSYISGYGENSLKNPLSNQWSYDGIAKVPDGVLAGGPNAYSNPLFYSNFAGKRYIDSNATWTTNEHTIYWNSTLVFLAALANQTSEPGTAPEVLPTPVPTAQPTPDPTATPEIIDTAEINAEEVAVVNDTSKDTTTVSQTADIATAESVNQLTTLMSGLLIMGIVLIIVIIGCTVIILRAMKKKPL